MSVSVAKRTPASVSSLRKFAMIFDDAVVNDRNAVNRVRMRVLFVWTAMRCPARVANAYETDERLTSKLALEVLEFTDCTPPREVTAFKPGDTGRIVSSIFKPPQRIHNRSGGWPSTQDTDDSTHLLLRFIYHTPREA